MTRADVVVLGGGLAGLCAALRVARAGSSVILLERAERLGGRAASQKHADFILNQGPHALYRGGAAARVLAEMNIPWRGAYKSVHRFAELGGELFPLPRGTVGMLASGMIGVRGKIELAQAMARLNDDKVHPSLSLTEWLAPVSDAPARAFLAGLFRVSTYCADTDRLSAAAAIRQVRRALEHGVVYLDGGWQTLVDRFAEAAREAGVAIQTCVEPSRIEREGRHLRVQLGEGRALMADAVVLAVGPRAAASVVPESAALARAAVDAIPVRAACLDVALRVLPNEEHHFTLGLDRPEYLSVHSVFARLAPEGGAVIHAARYLSNELMTPAQIRADLEALLDRAQPGWRSHVVHMRFLPAMTVCHAMPLASAERAPVAVADVANLFVAGDWVGDEGMLVDAALASACRAADLARRSSALRDVA